MVVIEVLREKVVRSPGLDDTDLFIKKYVGVVRVKKLWMQKR